MSGRPRSASMVGAIATAVLMSLGGMPYAVRAAAALPSATMAPQIGLGEDYATRRGRRTSAAALKRAAKKRRMARARASKRRGVRS